MRTFGLGLLMAGCLLFQTQGYLLAADKSEADEEKTIETGVLSYIMQTIDGKSKKLSDYEGKVLLLVNTASRCGFTPQYADLEKLFNQYEEKGFQVLAFPANNFLSQEPGTDKEIKKFCETKYGISFDLFSKISVKGKDIHPLYKYLTTETDFSGNISWNFNKFLVDRKGRVVDRFSTFTNPQSSRLVKRLEALLEES